MAKPTHAEVPQDPPGDADEPLPPIPDLDDATDGEDLLPEEPDDSLPPARPGPLRGWMKWVAAAAIVLAVSAILAYRAYHRRRVVAEGLDRARAALRLDTADGYRRAASILEPLVELDPLRAGSVRAFALAMLFADYRDEGAEAEAERLLVAPGRAAEVPVDAQLALAALALGRREAGNALTAGTRASAAIEAQVISARVALLAGNVAAAEAPAAAAADAGLAAGHALLGDVLRRTRGDPAASRTAYLLALERSSLHPRAAFGLAKLAHAGGADPADAAAALRRVAADARTPAPERGRAALHLAALRLREGDRARAHASLDLAGLDPAARVWAERAALALAAHRGPYRAVEGAPPALRSASDDDPATLAPAAPVPAPAAPAAAPSPAKAAPVKALTKAPAKVATKKAATKRSATKKVATRKTATKAVATKKVTAKKAPAKKPARR
jgi:hypothetical protein